jgi:hypothetical protein
MDAPAEAPSQEQEALPIVGAPLQEKSRQLNEELCNLKAGTYRAHFCEK